MIDISVSNVVKEFQVGSRVLDGITFTVDQGERVGLLGKNGAGKTTLFKLLTGEYEPDEGGIVIAPSKRLGLISQIPVYPPEYTVEDVLNDAFHRVQAMEQELKELAVQMAEDPTGAVMRRFDRVTAAFEAAGGYDTATELNKICNGLSIPDSMRNQLFSSLSGGEKTRVNLGRLILENTDILLLDEPTNHLDLHATEWLEEYLSRFKGTVLAISHDRYFLDRVVQRVVEIENGQAEFYSGNYTFYAIEKERRYEEKLKQYEKEQAKIKQLQEAADKLHLWAFMGNDKLHKRAFSMEKRIERLRKTDKPAKERVLTMGFGEREFKGDEVLVAKSLEKGFDGRTLFSGLDLEVEGGERIGLIGDNGAGKSTLIKLIMKEELPDSGKLRLGPTVKIGYLPQVVHFDHPERNLVDTMIYDQDCTAQTARNRLGAFNFRGEDVFKPVSALSGGEQSRLRLCMLMDEKINLLILDEPTNHLDIASREWIEGAVEGYDGALLFVSHDRYFIDRFATRIWELSDGKIHDFRGTFAEYREAKAKQAVSLPVKAEPPKEKKEKPKRTGGTKNLEKQVAAAERDIAKAEERLEGLKAEAEAAASDYVRLQKVYDQREQLEGELSQLYEQWEDLSAQLEEARG
ncbi:MAG: ABC-F family ATP-binding cassette domain-containing protein [Oscillospiraceae bacterium]|nr:ABC-F family ATP-binding cassette domain-containing protein [Oscillospiraceae bacterium]